MAIRETWAWCKELGDNKEGVTVVRECDTPQEDVKVIRKV